MSEEQKQASVPYFVHEGTVARMERIIRILAGLLVASLIIFLLNNLVWMRYTERQKTDAYMEGAHDAAGVHEQPDEGAD